jgi:hypothetical protein
MSKSLFTIDSFEKERILEMHQTALKNNYLNEQSTAVPTTVPTTVTPTKMNPLTTDKIILSNGSDITVYPTWNQQGTEPKSTFRILSNYGKDEVTNKLSPNVVLMNMANNELGGFNISLAYNCLERKITNFSVQSPKDSKTDNKTMKNAKYRLNGANGFSNTTQYPNLVQTHIYNLIDKNGVSTTEGPVLEIINYYCKTK